ncbi:MAG: conjugal transfer protein TraG N-terminal domain-containing protein [Deltaproteobacteria bacterium]|nr:conjugal transfer protein TraG N-terminal domain-containing protein [Deltaproteobacteria bacterium]MDE0355901.1 conjugal transfer protein TraG N-terminal domain-containing protein [Deltaproteobacteria bacterium]
MHELFTLGGGTYLVDLLNAVAAITGGGAFVTLAQLAGVAGLAWALFRTAFGGSWKDNARWMLLFIAVWGAMVVPRATVRVVDRLDPALAPAVVANVPIGLALFASVTSQVGDGLTRLTEQAFSLPADLTYRRHGLIFGARLAAEATRMEVTDAVFARNLRAYARQCVFHALLLGHISADDLRESTDVWRLVTAAGSPSAGASPARMVEYATRGAPSGTGATTVDRQIVTCADAATRLNGLWVAEIARASGIFGQRLFPGAATEALARAELMAALPAAHDFLIGASRTAAEILRQQMVLNAIHDAGEQWASEAGNAAALRAYTEARAETQTVSAYRAIGRQAETWVPMLRIVFECLYVGAFPMAVLLMLTPAGGAIFRSYFSGLVWLQSWGPLYAVLHRISMGEAAERMSAGALMPGGDIGVSLVAQAGIQAVASDVAVMSGYLSMSVPFLAAALAYGVGRATALATSVLAVGQEAASSAAQEGTTGNVSLANTQTDTHRFATVEGHQVRTSLHADTGRYTGYAPGGAGFTVTGDGTVVVDAGSATSRIPAAGVRLSESLAASHESRAGAAREQARYWSAEVATARTAAATDSAALVERFSRDVNTGVAHSRGVTESESETVQSLESHLKGLSEAGGITKEQAAALTSEARAGGGFDFIVKFGADGSVSWRGNTLSREAWNRMTDYAEQQSVLDVWSRAAEASRRYSTASGESELRSLEESFGANLTRMRRYGEQEALSQRQAESWSRQAAEVRSQAQSIDRDLGQPFFNWLSTRAGADGREIGMAGAMRLVQPQTPEDAEELRTHAAAFIAERFPQPKGPDPASAPGLADYERSREGMRESHRSGTTAAWAEWSGWARDAGRGGGKHERGSVGRGAERLRAETDTELDIREAEREARSGAAEELSEKGRAGVAAETGRPFGEHAAEAVPLVGEWLGARLYGTARNVAPDEGGKKEGARGGPMGRDEALGP